MPFALAVSSDFPDAKNYAEIIGEGLPGQVPTLLPRPAGNIATPEMLAPFDALMSFALKITSGSVRGLDRLAIVARWGVGYDMIDTEALTEAGIALTITPEGVKRPVAEAILTLVFALLKNLPLQDRTVRGGKWRGDLPVFGKSIPSQALGSVGCGNIARALFRLARPLGFRRLLACDPHVTQAQAPEGVEIVDMPTLFAESDIVTVNTLLNESTRDLIGEREFALMKPTAYFINTARGGIVHHPSLVAVLRERRIAGAGIDVFPVEPPPPDEPLRELDNVILAPHALAWTDQIMRDNGLEACAAVAAVARGEVPRGIVNKTVIGSPIFQRKLERLRRSM